MDYLIRKVKTNDEEILAYIQTESWKVAFKNIISAEVLEECTNINDAKEMYKKILGENFGHGYILEVNEKPHAIAYWDKSREEDMPGVAEIICIHSLKDNWGKGYGTKLMERVLKDIKDTGYEKVFLWVFEENHRAIKFYEAKGFDFNGKIKENFGAKEVCYERNL